MTWETRAERSSNLWLRLMTATYDLFGRRFCEALLYPIAVYFFVTSAETRTASLAYLRRMFPDESRRSLLFLSYLHVLEFSRALLDKFSVWHGDIGFQALSFEGKDELRALVNSGKGAIVLGAHFGNIEVLRAIARDVDGVVVNALMFTKHNPRFNALIESLDPRSRVRIIETDAVTPDLVANLEERLSRGELVALLADRVTPGSPDKTVSVDFLGDMAEIPSGPLILSSLLGRPIFLAFCARVSSGRYRVFFERFSDRISLPRRDRAAMLTEHAQRFARRLEDYCRRYPLQWFNFYDFWRDSARSVDADDRTGEGHGHDPDRYSSGRAEGVDPVN